MKIVKRTCVASAKSDRLKTMKVFLVNYQEKQATNQPFSSAIAESTIEHLINERHKRKQKM